MIPLKITSSVHTSCLHHSIKVDILELTDTYFTPTVLASRIPTEGTSTVGAGFVTPNPIYPLHLQLPLYPDVKVEIKPLLESPPLKQASDFEVNILEEAGRNANKQISRRYPIVFADNGLQAAFERQLLTTAADVETRLCPNCLKGEKEKNEKTRNTGE
ncbi:hypothetical protein TWF106_002550 [Orbilia oligospora]|uniref:Uncharacterized protein n=1 Tax=Orbilia oligospora TaxID=2813651 RepID=A0A6G1M5M5_ORBOL|nr:hypothetical protein TWF788_007723 [Orbilia oligospora]KAF3199325.1 hypothetical protein TWF679_001543 [Orbilia oligospora]KAF3225411.1 hypothetical protein TWF106_002550 [Orbilia oligospora]KAF3228085.1 hypothetical protein TWF191_003023 [Orbilia oligospora]KAF3243874.1 hypothetical protein TWF192_007941 [Orbilia oligospora]